MLRDLDHISSSDVSILVVMERTHRRRAVRRSSVRRSFNPCCDGTDSSTLIGVAGRAVTWFQSLL